MKYLIIFLILIIITGCQEMKKTSDNLISIGKCDVRPQRKLTRDNIKNINLSERSITESINIVPGQTMGYLFEGETGQQINIEENDNLCTWLIARNTQLVTQKRLPITGKYILQISPKMSGMDNQVTLSLEETQESFDQNDAVNLVKEWYAAKPTIFAPPFDAELVGRLATGKLYNHVLVDQNGGSVGWLKQNDCYYTYNYSNLNQVLSFSNVEERPILRINVSEQLRINGDNSACGSGATRAYTKDVTYWFEKSDGTWKIYDYKVGD